MDTPTLEGIVDTYLAAYAEPDAARRMTQIRAVWGQEGVLVDPPFQARGHQGLSDQAATLIAQFPGHRFRRSTALDAHHEFVRYGWQLRDPSGVVAVEGMDVMQLDVDGRIARVVGFFGAQPTPR